MKCEKIMNGWEAIVYNPNDHEKAVDEREILLSKKYKTIKQAHEAILSTLEPYDMTVSYSTIRKIGDGSYNGRDSKIGRSIRMNKCKILVNYEKIVKTTTKTKIEIKE